MKAKYKSNLIIIIIILSTIFTACSQQSSNNPSAPSSTDKPDSSSGVQESKDFALPTKTLSLVAGPTGGTFLTVAAGAAEIYTNNGLAVDALNGGGAQNIISVSNGQADLGITYLTTLPLALEGKGDFPTKFDNVSVLYAIAPNLEQIVVLNETNITKIPELKGQKFGGSLVGQGSQIIFNEVLSVYGMSEDDLIMTRGSQTECAELIKDKQVVAWGACTGVPSATVMDISSNRDVTFLGMTDEELDKLIEINPGYVKSKIPAGTYEGLEKDVPVACSYTVMVANNDMSEELAYWLTKTMVENIKAYQSVHSSLENFSPELMVDVGDMPLHPGAIKYYKEIGVL